MYCLNCGAQMTEGARFCQKCGADMQAMGAQPTQAMGAQPTQAMGAQPTQAMGAQPTQAMGRQGAQGYAQADPTQAMGHGAPYRQTTDAGYENDPYNPYYYSEPMDEREAKRMANAQVKEAKAAYGILEEYELQFEQWMVFQQSLPIMRQARENFMKVAAEKGEKKAFDHMFFWVRENNSPDDLEVFFRCLNH